MYFAKGESANVNNFSIWYDHINQGKRVILSPSVDYRIIEYHLNPDRKIRSNPVNGINEMYAKLILESSSGYIIEEFNPIRFSDSIMERESDSRIAWWIPESAGTSVMYYVNELRIRVVPDPEPEQEGQIFGEGLTNIEDETYRGKGITGAIIIADGVTTIGTGAFRNNQLTSINLPDSLESVGSYAFDDNQLTSIVIPDSVVSIEDRAFRNNQITSIDLSESLTIIEYEVLRGNQITSIDLPDSLIRIGEGAFRDNQITSIDLPDSLESIGKLAFRDNQITSVVIPNSITSIEDDVFMNNPLTEVSISSNTTYNSSSFPSNTVINVRGESELPVDPEPTPKNNIKLSHIDRVTGSSNNPQYVWDFTIDNEQLEQQAQGNNVDYSIFIDNNTPFLFSYSSNELLDSAKSRVYAYYESLIDGKIDFRLIPMEQTNGETLTFQLNTSMPLSISGGVVRDVKLVSELVAIEEELTEPDVPNIDRVFTTYTLNSDDYLQLYRTGFDEQFSAIYESNFNRVFEYPYNPITEHSIRENVIIGNVDTGATGYRLKNNHHIINFEGIEVPELYKDSRDYEGVEIQLFTPFHNEVMLSVEQVINQTISVQYVTDLSTGDFTLNIYSTISDHIIYTSTGIIGKEMPLYAQSESGKLVINEYRTIINNNIYNPYIEVTRQIPLSSSIGFNTRYESIIGDESGYIIVDDVQLSESIPSDKRMELMNLLRQGVIIN